MAISGSGSQGSNQPSLILWALLAIPAIAQTTQLIGGVHPEELLHPSGEFSARLLILALMITPLRMLAPEWRWLRWLLQQRRAIGVAAFGYAALHLYFYLLSMETIRNILAEFLALGIWTGWGAIAIFLPLALTSNDRAVSLMGSRWKSLHRLAYVAAALTLLHWIYVHNNVVPALVHFLPIAALESYRIFRNLRRG